MVMYCISSKCCFMLTFVMFRNKSSSDVFLKIPVLLTVPGRRSGFKQTLLVQMHETHLTNETDL